MHPSCRAFIPSCLPKSACSVSLFRIRPESLSIIFISQVRRCCIFIFIQHYVPNPSCHNLFWLNSSCPVSSWSIVSHILLPSIPPRPTYQAWSFLESLDLPSKLPVCGINFWTQYVLQTVGSVGSVGSMFGQSLNIQKTLRISALYTAAIRKNIHPAMHPSFRHLPCPACVLSCIRLVLCPVWSSIYIVLHTSYTASACIFPALLRASCIGSVQRTSYPASALSCQTQILTHHCLPELGTRQFFSFATTRQRNRDLDI